MSAYKAEDLAKSLNQVHACIDGQYVPARPINYRCDTPWMRIRLAWAVLTGKMDAIKWWKQ
ncbi:MAG: hypothetical protein WDN46_17540 [Methylocella sp.]